jgi:hypothetical protein
VNINWTHWRWVTFRNCLFENITGNSIYGYYPTHVEITNSTFINASRHVNIQHESGLYVLISNSIFTNATTAIRCLGTPIDESNNCFHNNQGNILIDNQPVQPDTSDILLDPIFLEPQNGDYHLDINSPCIGQGLSNLLNSDFDGNPRPNPTGTFPDIGAYENLYGYPVQPFLRSWTGAVNDQWENSDNWNPAGIPTEIDTINIPANSTFPPIIRLAGMKGNRIIIDQNATLEIQQPGTLMLRGKQNAEESLPMVHTDEITGGTEWSITVKGSVVSTGGSPVIERGICWGTSINPDLKSNHIICGSGAGIFEITVSELQQRTGYYFRAYAKNQNGTSYGKNIYYCP